LVENIFEKKIPAIIFTNNNEIPYVFKKNCNRYNVPLFKTNLKTSEFLPKITKVLEDLLTPTITYHGVLLDIHGVGILIEGEAGIGKSELALDMILKGHRFVADDIINIKFIPPNMIIGKSPDAIKSHMEIRGLGIINVEELFGIVSLREEKRIDMIIELTKSMHDVRRINIQNETKEILSVKLPFIKLPIANGRNVTTLVEMAARIYMMKKHNNFEYDPTKKFLEKIYNNPESTKL
jgi:HPr kinase/phosphorylase